MKCLLKSILSITLAISMVCTCTSCNKKPSQSILFDSPKQSTAPNYVPPSIDETKDSIVKDGYNDFAAKVKDNLKPYYGSVLIAYKGEIIYADGFNNADETNHIKNTMNTTFEIASMTKQFTAAAIMNLRDQGKLSVDDTIDNYFPEYKYGNRITIKNLLQMRSGIVDYADDSEHFFSDESVISNLYRKLSINESIDDAVIVDHLNDSDLLFEPGSKFTYCNTNYYLLSMIIQQVSGVSYEEYINTNIFKPLGMTKSKFGSKGSEAKGGGGADNNNLVIDLAKGDGCICSSVVDLYKWNQALFHGQIVSQKSFAEMTTFTDNYGYGLMSIFNYIGHGGSVPGFRSYGINDTKKDVTILLLSNSEKMKDNNSIEFYLKQIIKLCENEFY